MFVQINTGIGKAKNLTVIGHWLHWTVSFLSSDVNDLSYFVGARTQKTSTSFMPVTNVTVPSYDLKSSTLPVCDPYVFIIYGFSTQYTGDFSTILIHLPKSKLN